ncbi:MAG: aldo/keto reductase [Bryobacteraceae bacterium]
METRNIGSLQVTAVGLGCNNFGWRIDGAASAKVVDAALDAGINFFDTADMYGSGQSEEFLGKALGARRQKATVATKFGMKIEGQGQGARPDYVRTAAEASLKRLGTDHIDLYQLHRPDPSTPIEDTLGALKELVDAGKVREIGCSNFDLEQLREAEKAGKKVGVRFVSVQNQYSLFHRDDEKEVLPECERTGLAYLPYFPLANGLLTGKYRQGQPLPQGSRAQDGFGPKVFTEENLAKVEALIRFAESKKHSLLELAFAWLLSRKVVASAIAGAKSQEQVQANAAAAGWHLTPGDLAEIDNIFTPIAGHAKR